MQLTVLLIVVNILIFRTDGLDLSLLEDGIDYFFDAVEKIPRQLLTNVSNDVNSIQYHLYTPKNKKEYCMLEPPAERFDKCSFNAGYETKFLILGIVSFLTPENLFNVLKDAMLEHSNYNVIIVDWTLYNVLPFKLTYRNAIPVGEKVAEMMKFMQIHTNVSLKSLHCIGHSIGCHVCGVAGRTVGSLGRITGLDPGGFSKIIALKPNIRLRYTDADFVDVIHASDVYSLGGFGYLDPIGHMDFYPNGGADQPLCVNGNTYRIFNGKSIKFQTALDKLFCNHVVAIEYFIHSLEESCRFVATECENYLDFKNGQCSSGTKAEMGFYARKIEGIPANTKFYLTTLEYPPFCKEYH